MKLIFRSGYSLSDRQRAAFLSGHSVYSWTQWHPEVTGPFSIKRINLETFFFASRCFKAPVFNLHGNNWLVIDYCGRPELYTIGYFFTSTSLINSDQTDLGAGSTWSCLGPQTWMHCELKVTLMMVCSSSSPLFAGWAGLVETWGSVLAGMDYFWVIPFRVGFNV